MGLHLLDSSRVTPLGLRTGPTTSALGGGLGDLGFRGGTGGQPL